MPRPFPRAARRAALAATLLATAATAAPALAQNANRVMCSQPVKPTCVTSEITYEDDQRIDRCKRDVERYSESVEEYVACLQTKRDQQRETLEALRKEFQCRAEGGPDC